MGWEGTRWKPSRRGVGGAVLEVERAAAMEAGLLLLFVDAIVLLLLHCTLQCC